MNSTDALRGSFTEKMALTIVVFVGLGFVVCVGGMLWLEYLGKTPGAALQGIATGCLGMLAAALTTRPDPNKAPKQPGQSAGPGGTIVNEGSAGEATG